MSDDVTRDWGAAKGLSSSLWILLGVQPFACDARGAFLTVVMVTSQLPKLWGPLCHSMSVRGFGLTAGGMCSFRSSLTSCWAKTSWSHQEGLFKTKHHLQALCVKKKKKSKVYLLMFHVLNVWTCEWMKRSVDNHPISGPFKSNILSVQNVAEEHNLTRSILNLSGQ